jgi:RND family efflux transporter MFP subunit
MIVRNTSARQKKLVVTAAAIIAGVIAAGVIFRVHMINASEDDTPVKEFLPVATARKSTLVQRIQLPAEFRPYQEVDVDAKVRGYVKSLRVDVGDRLSQGEIIAELEIPEAFDDLAKATAALERSRHQAAQSQALFGDAQEMYQRLAAVMKERPELVAQQDLDQAKAKADAARAGSVAAESAVTEAQAYRTQQRDLLDYSKITAPFAGVVTRLYVSNGALVGDSAGRGASSSGRSVVHLSQLDRLRLVTKVPESLVPTIRDGASVNVAIPALNMHKTLTVTRMSHQVDLETRTMHVEIDFPNTDLAVTPGLYADVELLVNSRAGVISVPLEAVNARKEESGELYVLSRTGTVQRREVVLGIVTPNEAEIKSGVAEGEWVVVGAKPRPERHMIYEPRFVAAR